MGSLLVVAGWAGERAKRRMGDNPRNNQAPDFDPNKKGEKPTPPPDF
jgi:hypothetical protein